MKQSKTFEVKLNLIWYCQADSDVEAEQNAIDVFCLDDAPDCSTWNLSVAEMVNLDSILNQKNDICKIAVIEEMIDNTYQPQILMAMKEAIINIKSDKEIIRLISEELLSKIELKLKEVEGNGK